MYTIYTDGSCNINRKGANNIGAWGYVVINEHGVKIREGCEKVLNTTNNRMELCAVIASLKALSDQTEPVTLFTDSEYVSNSINKGWMLKWKSKNFKKARGTVDIPNRDLWIELDALIKPNVKIKWVRGHNGNIWNEYCDKLCSVMTAGVFRVIQ